MRTIIFVIGLVSSFSSRATAEQVVGTVVSSFSDSHALIQTERHIFRIRRSALAPADAKAIDRIGTEVSLSVPRSAIDMAWDYRIYEERPVATATRIEKAFQSESASKGDVLALRGHVLPSFQSDHFLVQAADRIYRIRAQGLAKSALDRLSKVGGRIEIALPPKAVDFEWQVEPAVSRADQRGVASDGQDHVVATEGRLFIRGTVMPSFKSPHHLVFSGNKYYMIDESTITRQTDTKPGTRLSIEVPRDKVIFEWAVPVSN